MQLWLAADTNLFFECKSLAQLPWGDLGHDFIVVLLTKPVLDEIDKHKKGTGRTRERAIEIFGIVRTMLTAGERETDIRLASPRVVIRLESARPDPNLKDDLDYSKPDEKLVGIVSTLQSHTSDHVVKLFTDDTGPASTANGLGLPFQMIDGSWRRPPSESTEARKIKELEKDLATYRAQEPRISIGSCENSNSSNVVQVAQRVAQALTTDELDELVALLRAKHPLKNDFAPPPPSIKTTMGGEVVRTEYLPPSDDDVAKYRDVAYPKWIERCRGILAELHSGRDVQAPPLVLRWPMLNDGTRPASQVRVVFEAKGALKLLRQPRKEPIETDEDGLNVEEAEPSPSSISTQALPSPPDAPAFSTNVTRAPPSAASEFASLPMPRGTTSPLTSGARWQDIDGFTRQLSGFEKIGLHAAQRFAADGFVGEAARLARSSSFGQAFGHVVEGTVIRRPIPIPSLKELALPPRDPEAFYYSDWPARDAVKEGALTCGLWRHQTGKEVFEFEVLFEQDGTARGTVECTVHAENLTNPVLARVIVARVIDYFSVKSIAEAMVETCR